MDDGKGRLRQIADDEIENIRDRLNTMGGMFIIGEEVKVKNSRFEITGIQAEGITLKLLPNKLLPFIPDFGKGAKRRRKKRIK